MKRFFAFVVCAAIALTTVGCDAFVRKFTRKKKMAPGQQEEMVLAPEEYKGPNMTKEELYRQHYLYWKSWHDELIESLASDRNHKKQLSCADETLKCLMQMRDMLNEPLQKKFEPYIGKVQDIRSDIAADIYGSRSARLRTAAEHVRQQILRDFSYPEVAQGMK